MSSLLNQLSSLQDENANLKKELALRSNKASKQMFGALDYAGLTQLLNSKIVKVPKSVTKLEEDHEQSYLDMLIANAGAFNTGVNNQASSGDANHILYKAASDMIAFGLIEQKSEKRGQSMISVLKTSEDGRRFIAETNLKMHRAKIEQKKEKPKEGNPKKDS